MTSRQTLDRTPVVLVLASGKARRFLASGGVRNKLHTPLAGRSVLEHVLAAVRQSGMRSQLVTGIEGGMGNSIAAGVAATPDATGWLILPGDLPMVSPVSLLRVAAMLSQSSVVVPYWQGQRGHPVGFAGQCRELLLQLRGDAGAASVVKTFREREAVTNLALDDAGIIQDIDTVNDLERMEALLRMRHHAL